MNETERIELLRAVAECAPKEMKATFREKGTYSETECVLFMGCEQSPLYLHLHPEWTDGEESFAMLDAMEKAGCNVALTSSVYFDGVHHPGYGCYVKRPWESFSMRPSQCHQGETRAEAIARAFVQVFQKRESPAR